jgi:hypothetical protein
MEDIEREAILERAGWRVVRIPYRKWLADPNAQLVRVVNAIDELAVCSQNDDDDIMNYGYDKEPLTLGMTPLVPPTTNTPNGSAPANVNMRVPISREQAALIQALKEGLSTEDETFIRVRDLLELKRLTQKLRKTLHMAVSDLAKRGFITSEDGEYFLLPAGRKGKFITDAADNSPRQTYRSRYR